jgi:membrane-bound metal-dependent hydrolase YbcI (DUF457 family)
MFIGHFAVSFAAKRVAPRASLGMTFVAAQLADLLWPIFLLTGVEAVAIRPTKNPFLNLGFTHYPWSHSLALELVWGALLGGLYWMATRQRREAIVVALLVPSHWLLDYVVHVPDLPLYPGSSTFGLGLWEHPLATMIVELLVFGAGVAIYAAATRPKDRAGKYGLWGLVAFLLFLYAASIVSPPPSSVSALAWGALIGWPLMLWPWWVDRHRQIDPRPPQGSPAFDDRRLAPTAER